MQFSWKPIFDGQCTESYMKLHIIFYENTCLTYRSLLLFELTILLRFYIVIKFETVEK